MGKRIIIIPLLFFFITGYVKCSDKSKEHTTVHLERADSSGKSIPAGLQKLLNAYPEFLDHADENNLYWKDGTVMIYEDGIKDKTHDEKLDNPDIEDMMSQKYVKGSNWEEPPAKDYEPGRIRYEPFFLKMYGNSSSEVKRNLVKVKWADGSMIEFSSINGAADSLAKVSEELSGLPTEFQKYFRNIGGTFVWRNIAGTDRLSNHSFGTAIDINTKYSDYWKWNSNVIYTNRIPVEIAEIFEKHGFIWGGKWYHYDTMHFEYRPELTGD
ncbi:MAG: M15 family metallopeptidase [Bacteroidetes bacterium]|nr:M15 family metallopeptidase [Bacteroidota bacterium]